MTRVALVSGGTRGIGAAISKLLHDKGYRVASVYARDDSAAKRFHQESHVAVYKSDVGDFAQCQEGIAQVTRDLGDIEILINNAGITRDATLQRMAPE